MGFQSWLDIISYFVAEQDKFGKLVELPADEKTVEKLEEEYKRINASYVLTSEDRALGFDKLFEKMQENVLNIVLNSLTQYDGISDVKLLETWYYELIFNEITINEFQKRINDLRSRPFYDVTSFARCVDSSMYLMDILHDGFSSIEDLMRIKEVDFFPIDELSFNYWCESVIKKKVANWDGTSSLDKDAMIYDCSNPREIDFIISLGAKLKESIANLVDEHGNSIDSLRPSSRFGCRAIKEFQYVDITDSPIPGDIAKINDVIVLENDSGLDPSKRETLRESLFYVHKLRDYLSHKNYIRISKTGKLRFNFHDADLNNINYNNLLVDLNSETIESFIMSPLSEDTKLVNDYRRFLRACKRKDFEKYEYLNRELGLSSKEGSKQNNYTYLWQAYAYLTNDTGKVFLDNLKYFYSIDIKMRNNLIRMGVDPERIDISLYHLVPNIALGSLYYDVFDIDTIYSFDLLRNMRFIGPEFNKAQCKYFDEFVVALLEDNVIKNSIAAQDLGIVKENIINRMNNDFKEALQNDIINAEETRRNVVKIKDIMLTAIVLEMQPYSTLSSQQIMAEVKKTFLNVPLNMNKNIKPFIRKLDLGCAGDRFSVIDSGILNQSGEDINLPYSPFGLLAGNFKELLKDTLLSIPCVKVNETKTLSLNQYRPMAAEKERIIQCVDRIDPRTIMPFTTQESIFHAFKYYAGEVVERAELGRELKISLLKGVHENPKAILAQDIITSLSKVVSGISGSLESQRKDIEAMIKDGKSKDEILESIKILFQDGTDRRVSGVRHDIRGKVVSQIDQGVRLGLFADDYFMQVSENMHRLKSRVFNDTMRNCLRHLNVRVEFDANGEPFFDCVNLADNSDSTSIRFRSQIKPDDFFFAVVEGLCSIDGYEEAIFHDGSYMGHLTSSLVDEITLLDFRRELTSLELYDKYSDKMMKKMFRKMLANAKFFRQDIKKKDLTNLEHVLNSIYTWGFLRLSDFQRMLQDLNAGKSIDFMDLSFPNSHTFNRLFKSYRLNFIKRIIAKVNNFLKNDKEEGYEERRSIVESYIASTQVLEPQVGTLKFLDDLFSLDHDEIVRELDRIRAGYRIKKGRQ